MWIMNIRMRSTNACEPVAHALQQRYEPAVRTAKDTGFISNRSRKVYHAHACVFRHLRCHRPNGSPVQRYNVWMPSISVEHTAEYWWKTVSARLRPRRPSATAFVDYVSACRSTYRACYHRQPSLPGGCCICLEQSAGDSTFIAVIASFPQ